MCDMKHVLLQINVDATNGSNGGVAFGINDIAVQHGWDSYIAYGRRAIDRKDTKIIRIGSKLNNVWHGIESRLFDNHGLSSRRATKKLIKQIDDLHPDLIHLHNIHGYFLNYRILFNYLSKYNIPIIWTLHDCWSITGHCAHFVSVNCEKWQTQCEHCPLKASYPRSFLIDNSRHNFLLKKKCFTSIKKMIVVGVSSWIADYVKQSYLSKYPIKVIHNGIDLDIFKPTQSSFRNDLKIGNRKMILGVSSTWTESKGLNEFIQLSKNPSYCVVLVGVNNEVKKNLPSEIVAIDRTENVQKLVEIYSSADVFVNPTYADTFPTVNLEALACGTPVITYRTGGSPESIDESCGKVVECGDFEGLVEAIDEITSSSFDYATNCRQRAVSNFDMKKNYNKYFSLYNELI